MLDPIWCLKKSKVENSTAVLLHLPQCTSVSHQELAMKPGYLTVPMAVPMAVPAFENGSSHHGIHGHPKSHPKTIRKQPNKISKNPIQLSKGIPGIQGTWSGSSTEACSTEPSAPSPAAHWNGLFDGKTWENDLQNPSKSFQIYCFRSKSSKSTTPRELNRGHLQKCTNRAMIRQLRT